MSWPWLTEPDLCAQVDSETFHLTEPITAYKTLHLGVDHAEYERAAFCRRVVMSAGHVGEHVPSVSCTCGFYAWNTLAAANEWGSYARPNVWRVELSGVVIEHERGWRAERCTLVEQLRPGDPVETLHELGQATTRQVRLATGWGPYDGPTIRGRLKAAAKRGECVEIPTSTPNNYGGHMWLSLADVAKP